MQLEETGQNGVKIDKARYQKIFSATDKMPQNLHIKDECGELTRSGHCDNDKAKFKFVILTFYNIQEGKLSKKREKFVSV